MTDNLNRQLVAKVRELENELIAWGKKADWAMEQDDPGWWEDVFKALSKRGRELNGGEQ